jgi:UDP:flavonoid glycosyltransferase YjiC (YdhE family)
MSRITFRVSWPTGTTRYHTNVKEARRVFNNSPDPELDGPEPAPMADTLHKVWLTRDAFERAYNGGGGFEEREELLAPKPKGTK